ncbi:Cytochrome P450 [Macleaya cordata]|uniref:N-methylcoclaurine 3'-monooxygenase n=1 Tax=Macleaya cordata TaxID=56857 RepID=A0A200PMQ1_MACCD|nr:Cytochrome P450 [Macleaya cordata]
MEYVTLVVWLLLACAFLHLFISSSASRGRKSSVTNSIPPGPVPLPIVGSLFKLSKKPHESLSQLAKIYGPLMSLKLGSLTTVIVSSPTMAKEVLQKNDQSLSNRNVLDAVRALNFNENSMIWSPPSHRWRNLRKLSNSQIFSTQKLDSDQNLRRQKLNDLISFVRQYSVSGSAVNIGQAAFTTLLNLISNTCFSIDLVDLNSDSAQNFKSIFRLIIEEAGKPNLADYFPILRWIDPQGIRRRMTKYFAEIDEIFDGLIDQKLQGPKEKRTSNDLLDMLLDHSSSHENGFDQLGRPEIKGLLKDLFLAGTDTISSTLEWAMAELLRNPYKMTKARQELAFIIGKDQPIEESDIVRLPYLQAIVKETLRLHPPGPLLVPRKAVTDVKIHDFIVPKNAQVLVNVWSIGRDRTIWTDPDAFNPERFLELEMINYRGQDFELIPFGSGRRICPGLPLAHRMVHLMLGSLINLFDWKLENGLKPEDMDMEEKMGKSSVTNLLPPGPVPLPIVGSILKLGKKPHESLSQLANAHGPLMSLKLGSLTTVIVSSPTMAKEILQKNDQSFSNRNVVDAVRALNFSENSMIWLPSSYRWRNLRKLSNSQIFTTQKLDSNQNLRRQKLNDLISFVHQYSVSGSPVDIGQAAFTTVLNLISNTCFSIALVNLHSDSAQNFKSIFRVVMEEVGKPNLADYFPILRWIDPQEKRTSNDLLDSFWITAAAMKMDLISLDVLKSKLYLRLDFLIAGTDTISSTVEWVMAELLRNPYKMTKARQELADIIGKDQPIEESDIVRLPYLQAIVKETLRLHPPGPLLVPRKVETDVKIHDFIVPKNVHLLVNVWSIGRDRTIWTDPDAFNLERFLELEMINYRGQDFEFIPFGSGRRICPGLSLAHRMKHDQSFSSRTIIDAVRVLNHHECSMVWLPASHRWRNLRKLSNSQIFTTQKLDSNQNLRCQKLNDLISFVHQSSVSGSPVDIGQAAFTTVLNLMSNTCFSIDLADLNSVSAHNFKSIVRAVLEEAGKPNLSDYFPILRWIDPQGIRRRMMSHFTELEEIFDRMIDQKLVQSRERKMGFTSNDLLDTLLDQSQQENGFEIGRSDIQALLKDFFVAGSDTTSSTVEWAMAELLRNSYTMTKARQELTGIIGKDRPIKESDIIRLPYLQAIVKETLRLHPPVPLLVPHKAETDVKIHNFIVPKNAQVLVNVWAIGRDRTIWANPTCFNLERFLESEIDFKGQDFELIPFGSGRRICPGLPLAHRMVHLMLGSLINLFDWKLEDGLKPEDLDMEEKFGLTLSKAEPLRAVPTKV